MGNCREELLERVTRSIDILRDIQSDSRTPLNAAIAVVEPLRKLTDYRRAMRIKEFHIAAQNPAYGTAVASLMQVTNTLATDLDTYEKHMEFVEQVVQAAAAVLAVVIAVGAMGS